MVVFAAAPPSLPHVERFVRRARGNMFGGPLPDEEPDTKRSRTDGSGLLLPPPPLPDIGQSEAEAGLRRGVIRLCAHVGYHTAQVWAAVLIPGSVPLTNDFKEGCKKILIFSYFYLITYPQAHYFQS
jgi:hypothetical protein